MKVATIPYPYAEEITEEQKKNILFWIEELRSGKLKQTHSVLKSDRLHYCCLGVACEIHRVPNRRNGREYEFLFGERINTAIPDSLWFKEKFGFYPSDRVCFMKDYRINIDLVFLNDENFSFSIIADIIESVFIKRERKEYERP